MTFIPLPNELIDDYEIRWNSFCDVIQERSINLPADNEFIETLKYVFISSAFLSKNCINSPEILTDLLKGEHISKSDLYRQYKEIEYENKISKALDNIKDESQLSDILRKIRTREMIRIAWRDIAGWSTLNETLSDLSSLADACVKHCFKILYKWLCSKYGIPRAEDDGSAQNIIVLGMGKLGARELNFSSDIDLMFAYPQKGFTDKPSKSISNEEFFLRLARLFLKIFSTSTSVGMLFRVDMRLRPYGENGPLIMTFDSIEQYYQTQGREWERYALIKSRVIAGSFTDGQNLLDKLKPFIFRRYLDFAVFEALREMKNNISVQVKKKGLQNNIKLGQGGIREIEFFGQIFQLIRGGVVPELQARPILKTLSILANKGYIPVHVCEELTMAYVFLRKTENRIQEYDDLQLHDIPSDYKEKTRLAFAMGFKSWNSFYKTLKKHTAIVHSHFDMLLKEDAKESSCQIDIDLTNIWNNIVDKEHSHEMLVKYGFKEADEILYLLDLLRQDHNTILLSIAGKRRLDKLIPLILKQISKSDSQSIVLNRIIDLIKSIERRSCYIALLIENPIALTHLIKLAEASPWIISFLSKYPVLLDELIDPRTLYAPPDKIILKKEIAERLKRVKDQDIESYMIELCIFKQSNTLRVAAADVSGASPLMRVSDHLTDIAEVVLEKVLKIVWRQLVIRYGLPSCVDKDSEGENFIVVGYGKLGGIELGYASDLDLVFLHDAADGYTQNPKHAITNSEFYIRLGQRIISALTLHTSAGVLYDADTRLRPSGSSGVLVINIDSFKDYCINHAWTWEHQALVRARPICGDLKIAKKFNQIRKEILSQKRSKEKLKTEVLQMRKRMLQAHSKNTPGIFDLKHDIGGIIDIEFLVQYLVLLYSHKYLKLLQWTDNARLLETMAQEKIMSKESATILHQAYITYRLDVHRLNLQKKAAKVPKEKVEALCQKVIKIWNSFMNE